jgi:hypothetical protein
LFCFVIPKKTLVDLNDKNFELDSVVVNSILGSFIGTEDEEIICDFYESARKISLLTQDSYIVVAKFYSTRLDIQLKKMLKKGKYPPRQQMKALEREAIEKVQKIFADLLEDKFTPSDGIMFPMAKIANLAKSPDFALWIKQQIDEYTIQASSDTLKLLLHSFGVKPQYKEPANEVLQQLITMSKDKKPDHASSPADRSDGLVDDVYIDPQEEFDFQRIETRKKLP